MATYEVVKYGYLPEAKFSVVGINSGIWDDCDELAFDSTGLTVGLSAFISQPQQNISVAITAKVRTMSRRLFPFLMEISYPLLDHSTIAIITKFRYYGK